MWCEVVREPLRGGVAMWCELVKDILRGGGREADCAMGGARGEGAGGKTYEWGEGM
jgi:hypothetical protein